jgi:hypothetical protein
MAKAELLSRGSAFLVPMEEHENCVHICTSGHVVHPFAYPHYYKAEWEWLRFVKPEHVTFRIEARDTTGRMMFSRTLR